MQKFILVFILVISVIGCDCASDSTNNTGWKLYRGNTKTESDCDDCKKIYMKLDCQLNHTEKCEWSISERCRCKK